MNKPTTTPRGPTRRRFLEGLAASAGVAACWHLHTAGGPDAAARRAASLPGKPVAAIHVDEPYLDRSGTAAPYHPSSARGGEPIAGLPEEVMRCHHCYL